MWSWIKRLFKKKSEPTPVSSDIPVTPIGNDIPRIPIQSTDFPYGKGFLDLSHHNETVDLMKLKSYSLIILKCSEGTTYHDKCFDSRWLGLKLCNIPRGAYHFYRCDNDPISQAKFFVQSLGEFSEKDVIILDFETADKSHDNSAQDMGDLRDNKANALKFLKAVKVLTGIVPWFYTYDSVIKEIKFEKEFIEFPLWYARYIRVVPSKAQGPWSEWIGWQYTDKGSVDGVSDDVDMNWFKGIL